MLTKIMMMEATMANMWIKFQSMTSPSKGRRFLESAFEASRMAFKRNVVALFNIMFYLLVFYELCNGASKEVDEQCWENDDNRVNNVCHRENLIKRKRVF